MKRRRDGATPANDLTLGQPGAGAVAVVAAVAPWSSSLLPPSELGGWVEWQRFHRFVSLSGLGWAFVAAALLWELFAVAFSQCAGGGWGRGAYFFAWGLGILALGFCLRKSRKRPAVSRLFLGVNILVLGVLSLVVATR